NGCGGVADQAGSGSCAEFQSLSLNLWRLRKLTNLGSPQGELSKTMEDSPMSRRFIVAMLGLGLALILMPQVSLAVEDHLSQAIEHTRQAIDHGKQGHADVLVTHAEAALTHAEASEKAKANPHKAEAIKHLKEAIDQGKQGNADEATTHAEIALNHLQQVN
ncbi:MAG: small metal-binding protein SmbP, partial [Methylocella sp.]